MGSVIFLGAGASKPFGISTMQEMVTEFEEKLGKDSPELYQYYSEIKNSLVAEYGESQIDIESMFSVIQGIANKTEPKELGHFAFYYMTKNSRPYEINPREIELATQVQNELENYIKTTCSFKLDSNESTEIYKNSYIPLFSSIEGDKQTYHNEYTLVHDWKTFTTNYDFIFEGFWRSFQEPIDHFDRIENSNIFTFSRKVLGPHSLSKLHGSLDWTKNIENGDIIRRKESSFDTVITEGNVLLFPIQQKDMYLHPWFTLFQDLKTGLLQSKTWYVIGYAFNDPFIFNVFKETLSYDIAKLILINPDAVKIRDKFPEELKKKITPLPIKFGDKYFADDFEGFINSTRTLNFDISTPVEEIGIHVPSEFIDYDILKIEGFSDTPALDSGDIPFKTIIFNSGNTNKNHISLSLETRYDYFPDSQIDLRITTPYKEPVDVTITNQERAIDSFVINNWELVNEDHQFYYKRALDFNSLLCI